MRFTIPDEALLQIATKLAEGKSYRAIAKQTSRAPESIRTRMRKFKIREGCKNDVQLIAKLMKQNRINPQI